MKRSKLFPVLVALFVLVVLADVALLGWRALHGWHVDPLSLLGVFILVLTMGWTVLRVSRRGPEQPNDFR